MTAKSQHTYPTADADAAMQGTRDASIDRTIKFAEINAECPVCHEHPLDCICYGRFGKRDQRDLPVVQTWQPWKIATPINP